MQKEWAEAIDDKKEQYKVHDLYKLVAAKDGYYQCKHCPSGRFFLKKGEVYRYGTTGIGRKERGYNKSWLDKHFLNYIHILTADLTTVKMEEVTLIGAYVLLPENLNRPLNGSLKAKNYWHRLVLPPGNSRLD